MKSKTGQDKGTDILLCGHRLSSLLYALASDDQPLQGKKVFIKKEAQLMDQKSAVCSVQPAHMQYDTIYTDVTPPSFLTTIILP